MKSAPFPGAFGQTWLGHAVLVDVDEFVEHHPELITNDAQLDEAVQVGRLADDGNTQGATAAALGGGLRRRGGALDACAGGGRCRRDCTGVAAAADVGADVAGAGVAGSGLAGPHAESTVPNAIRRRMARRLTLSRQYTYPLSLAQATRHVKAITAPARTLRTYLADLGPRGEEGRSCFARAYLYSARCC